VYAISVWCVDVDVCVGLCVVCGCMCGGAFPEQESNPCLLQWQADCLPLSHQGSPVPSLSAPVLSNRTTKFFLNHHYPLLQEALQANLTGPLLALPAPHVSL